MTNPVDSHVNDHMTSRRSRLCHRSLLQRKCVEALRTLFGAPDAFVRGGWGAVLCSDPALRERGLATITRAAILPSALESKLGRPDHETSHQWRTRPHPHPMFHVGHPPRDSGEAHLMFSVWPVTYAAAPCTLVSLQLLDGLLTDHISEVTQLLPEHAIAQAPRAVATPASAQRGGEGEFGGEARGRREGRH